MKNLIFKFLDFTEFYKIYFINKTKNLRFFNPNYQTHKFWFNYLSTTKICQTFNYEDSLYCLFATLKEIMNESGIIKELLPETRAKNKQNEQ